MADDPTAATQSAGTQKVETGGVGTQGVRTPTAVGRWERGTEWPLLVAALAFLAAYAVPILQPTAPDVVVATCRIVTWATWLLFGIDFVVRVVLADHRLRYLVSHWYDLVIIVLPVLRPLRLLRLVPLLRFLNKRARRRLRGQVALYVGAGALLLGGVAALAVLDAERNAPQSNIGTFGDAVWWAVTTMATVGYGDRYPVTAAGRGVGVALMLGGIALLGTVTATLASWLVDAVAKEASAASGAARPEPHPADPDEDGRLDELRQTVQRLEGRLAAMAERQERLIGLLNAPSAGRGADEPSGGDTGGGRDG